MKYIGRVLGWILLGINICMAVLLLICAYSSYINPVAHPVWSCAGLAFPAFLITNVLFFFFWLVVYRRYALVSLLTFFCCFGAIRTYIPINLFEKEPPGDAVKVLSYNTMAFEQGHPNLKDNPNSVLEYLRNSNADIICLQEYILSNRLAKKDVDYALRNYPYKHYYKLTGANGLGCYSRYPILSAHPVEYDSRNNGSVAYTINVKVQSGNGFGISYNQNHFYFRIDHILLSKNLESYQCTVDKTIKSSDHYPIWCFVAKK